LQGIQSDTDHDEQPGAAEVERHIEEGDHQIRQDGDSCQEYRARQGDPGQDPVDVFSRTLAGPDPRYEAAVFLHVVRQIHRIQNHGRVEVGEQDDQRRVDHHVHRVRRPEHVGQRFHERVVLEERADSAREHDDGLGEDDRNHTRGIDPQRDVRVGAAVNAATDYLLGVLYRYSSLPLGDGDDTGDDQHHEEQHHDQFHPVHLARLELQQRIDNVRRISRDDTREDDE